MTEEEWAQALGPETETVEHKQSDRDVDELLHAACAFANDLGNLGRPGFLVLGVNKRGQPIGVDTSDSAIQQVVNHLTSTKIVPAPSFDIAQTEREDRGILAQMVRKPIFDLKQADGIGGGQIQAVAKARREFEVLVTRLRDLLGLPSTAPGTHGPQLALRSVE